MNSLVSLLKTVCIAGVLGTLFTLPSSCSSRPTLSEEPRAQIFSDEVGSLSDSQTHIMIAEDPLFDLQWYLKNSGQLSRSGLKGVVGADLQFRQSDNIPEKNHYVVLAVIDSGVDLSHPDLDTNRFHFNPGEDGIDNSGRNRRFNGIDDDNNGYIDDYLGWSFSANTNDVSDSLGHGTHIAGLLASRSNNGLGIANPWRGFKILPIQIFDSAHPTADHETIAKAIHYAVDNGAHVISASFGSSTPSETMRSAVAYAAQHNVTLVSAVGNFRKNTDEEPTYPASFGFPNQISVGSSERRDLASNFSNYGLQSVDIFAPGEELLSTGLNGTYIMRSGTSQACPLVSAAVATAKYLNFEETPKQIINRVMTAADALPGLKVFSADALRLNVDNIIQNKAGVRFEKVDQNSWLQQNFSLESEHPYRSNVSIVHTFEAPKNAKNIKVHFNQFKTQSTDLVELLDQNGKVIISLSGQLGEFWTPALQGNKAHLRFTTDRFVSDFGWSIDHVAFLE